MLLCRSPELAEAMDGVPIGPLSEQGLPLWTVTADQKLVEYLERRPKTARDILPVQARAPRRRCVALAARAPSEPSARPARTPAPRAQGFVTWNRNALQRDLENGVYGRVSDDEMPWNDVWALTGDDNADASARAKCGLEVFDEFVSATTYVSPDDETAVGAAWRDAEQLADKALLEWSRVFLR